MCIYIYLYNTLTQNDDVRIENAIILNLLVLAMCQAPLKWVTSIISYVPHISENSHKKTKGWRGFHDKYKSLVKWRTGFSRRQSDSGVCNPISILSYYKIYNKCALFYTVEIK